MKSCSKRKVTEGLVFDTNKYNINDDINSYDAYKIMMNFDCFRSFNSALALTQMSLVQPIDIEEKINDLMENKEDGEEENKMILVLLLH